jgi:hypothetical protein
MKNLTLVQKEQLAAYESVGRHVRTVAYDPTKLNPAPPSNADEFYRETSTNLVEIIYVDR